MEIINPDPATAQTVFGKYALANDGKTLRSKLEAEDLANYEKIMGKSGIPVAAFDPLDPWAAGITLSLVGVTKAGFDPNSGVEAQLTSAAKASGKKIGEVETFEGQLKIFDDFSQERQLAFLTEAIKSANDDASELEALVASWAKGDTEQVAALMNTGLTDRVLFDRLLTQRNANWARWIASRLEKPGTIFMAVGAGHLAGTTSVQHMLTAYGIEAKRIEY
jgi:uncharacterized protein YbaP (TraB family)